MRAREGRETTTGREILKIGARARRGEARRATRTRDEGDGGGGDGGDAVRSVVVARWVAVGNDPRSAVPRVGTR